MGFIFSSCKETEDQSQVQKNTQTQKQRQPQKAVSQNDIAVMDLKKTRDKLFEKQKQLEVQIETTEKEIILLVQNQKKERAKFTIEKKKLYQKYLDNIDNKSMVIQRMIQEVQQATMDQDVSETMKNANDFLKDIQESINLEQMQDVAMDLQENQQQQEQFDELFKQYGVSDDQDQLEGEYDKLEAMYLNEQTDQIAKPNIDENLIQQQKQQEQQQQQQQQQEQEQEQVQEKEQPKVQQKDELDEMLA